LNSSIQTRQKLRLCEWIPAYAGMTHTWILGVIISSLLRRQESISAA